MGILILASKGCYNADVRMVDSISVVSDICHNSDHCSLPSSAGSFEDLLTGKMAEITISLTKSPELRPGERPVVGRYWHFSLPILNTGPTFPKSIWTKRTRGGFSQ